MKPERFRIKRCKICNKLLNSGMNHSYLCIKHQAERRILIKRCVDFVFHIQRIKFTRMQKRLLRTI